VIPVLWGTNVEHILFHYIEVIEQDRTIEHRGPPNTLKTPVKIGEDQKSLLQPKEGD